MLCWVFGGTAVGKKWFIHEFTGRFEDCKGAWMEDGLDPPACLSGKLPSQHLLIRWQWQRERLIYEFYHHRVEVKQSIWLIKAKLRIRMMRARSRAENEAVFYPKKNIQGEARKVGELCRHLSKRMRLPMSVIDTTTSDIDWDGIRATIDET